MSNQNLQTLKGFRDFLPTKKRQRDFVAQKFIETFKTFGFEPLETPTLEYASLLLGKYGEEADKLVYSFEDRGGRKVALKYDQTVPVARILAQYQNELPKYFRRYQMQNVFRADKPQKGRFREFSQCDIDIFGSREAVADAEIVACGYQALASLGFQSVTLKLNDRQLLTSVVLPFTNDKVNVFSLIQSIDKLDKIGESGVVEELVAKGMERKSAEAALMSLKNQPCPQNLSEIITAVEKLGVPSDRIVYNPTLARGLDYYTGMIVEIAIDGYEGGSVAGGGRYDNLIQQLGGVDIPAVGIAFGFDRVVEAAEQLGLIPGLTSTATVAVTVFSPEYVGYSLEIARYVRNQSIAVEVIPQAGDIGKQLKIVDQKGIPFAIIAGESERSENRVTVKDMRSGDQQQVSLGEAVEVFVKAKDH